MLFPCKTITFKTQIGHCMRKIKVFKPGALMDFVKLKMYDGALNGLPYQDM